MTLSGVEMTADTIAIIIADTNTFFADENHPLSLGLVVINRFTI